MNKSAQHGCGSARTAADGGGRQRQDWDEEAMVAAAAAGGSCSSLYEALPEGARGHGCRTRESKLERHFASELSALEDIAVRWVTDDDDLPNLLEWRMSDAATISITLI